MPIENVTFNSDGLKLVGHLYVPENVKPPYPCVVMGGGWCYVKELIQPEYAQFLADAGYAALSFDYRNLGESEGQVRQHINPWEQIDDLINAVTYVCDREDIDDNRIGIWGISYAGGHVFPVAALDPRIRVIMSVVPMLDGWYNTLRANSNVGLRELWDIVAKDRVERLPIQLTHTKRHPFGQRLKLGQCSRSLKSRLLLIMNTGLLFKVLNMQCVMM